MPSPVESIKEKSRNLRGAILATLKKASATHFSEEDYQILKFHGCYQQDDRDLRNERKKLGQDKAWILCSNQMSWRSFNSLSIPFFRQTE